MTGHAGQVRAVVTGAGSPEIKWLLNPPTTSRRRTTRLIYNVLGVVLCCAVGPLLPLRLLGELRGLTLPSSFSHRHGQQGTSTPVYFAPSPRYPAALAARSAPLGSWSSVWGWSSLWLRDDETPSATVLGIGPLKTIMSAV